MGSGAFLEIISAMIEDRVLGDTSHKGMLLADV